MPAMNKNRSFSLLPHVLFLLTIAFVLGLACQGAAAQAGGQYNLFKEVMAKKDTIVWRNAPGNFIPPSVCRLLQVCGGNPDKFIALPPATENGQRVGRGLILTKDANHNDAVMLLNQSLDIYFFLLSPEGNLQKTAYREAGKSWLVIANSLAQPIFDKDKQIWHDRVEKLGGAPAKR
jgi:hypothetical protein